MVLEPLVSIAGNDSYRGWTCQAAANFAGISPQPFQGEGVSPFRPRQEPSSNQSAKTTEWRSSAKTRERTISGMGAFYGCDFHGRLLRRRQRPNFDARAMLPDRTTASMAGFR